MGFGMWDMGCGIWDLGCGIWDLGSGIWDLGYGIWNVGCGMWDMGSGIWDLGCKELRQTAENNNNPTKKLNAESRPLTAIHKTKPLMLQSQLLKSLSLTAYSLSLTAKTKPYAIQI